MPYKVGDTEIARAISYILKEKEFQEGLQNAHLTSKWLNDRLLEKVSEIRIGLAPFIAQIDDAQRKLDNLKLPSRSWITRVMLFLATRWLRLLLLVVVLIATVPLATRFISLFSPNALKHPISVSIEASILPLLICAGVAVYVWFDLARYSNARASSGFDQHEGELERLKADFSKRVLPDLLRQEARATIAAQSTPNYDVELRVTEARGLAEIYNPIYDISTDSVDAVRYLLKAMPGGSIGISGSRGAGKSTLLRTFCDESLNEIDGRKALTVLTSAPVEYDAREFILYLFSAVCRRVIGAKPEPSADQDIFNTPVQIRRRSSRGPLFFKVLLIELGIVCVAMAGWLAFQSAKTQLQDVVAKTAPGTPGAAGHTTSVVASPKQTNFYVSIADGLGLKPPVLLIVGTVFLVLALSPLLQKLRLSWRSLYAADSDSFISYGGVKDLAYRWLREIRFQQSFTTGWSGSLKLPIGDAGVNRASSLAQKQLTLPEITAGFVHLLRELASDQMIVVGIDEMDKLSSDEQAQKFLNELKALFGVSGVFYLVSVSESAMSSFERRGLSFRDAFDSAFDSVLYLDNLRFVSARTLVARRVIGLPLQYVALCHALAGGLPRDLIRFCRALLEIRRNSSVSDLSSLGALLVGNELRSKWRASLVAVKRMPDSPARRNVLSLLYQEPYEDLPHRWVELAEQVAGIASELNPDALPEQQAEQLRAICVEFSVYVYFCATLRQFFVSSLGESGMRQACADGQLDRLSEVVQAFSMDHHIAKRLLDKFRLDTGLGVALLDGSSACPSQLELPLSTP